MSDLLDTLHNMSKIPAKEINLARAKEFRYFTIEQLRLAGLSLKPLQDRTIARRKMNLGGPLYDTSELAENMQFKNIGENAEAGYFSEGDKVHSDSKKTNLELAVIHTTHHAYPRPFLLNSAERFENEKDDEIIDEIIERWWQDV